jgi:hypothetical protein
MAEMQDVRQETGLRWTTATHGPCQQVPDDLIQAWLLLAHCGFLRKPEQDALLASNPAFKLLQLPRVLDLDINDIMAASITHSACYPMVPPSPPQGVTDNDEGWVETEKKRWALRAAFVLDCLSSMVTDRPTMLHEEKLVLQLPSTNIGSQD